LNQAHSISFAMADQISQVNAPALAAFIQA
jgi:hypothetical protein